jgi:hypothetical protein
VRDRRAVAAAKPYPETIPLPNGWQPEGIATGFGNDFFAGSRSATGGIFKGNLKTGRGSVLVQRGGAATGQARVYRAANGKLLHLTGSDFDVPTTIASKGGFVWAVNARFTTPPTPTTTYDVVRVTR